MKQLERRLDAAELALAPDDDTGGPVSMFVDDLGGGCYRDTATGIVYREGTLPRGTIMILSEKIVEANE